MAKTFGVKWKPLLISIVIALGAGALSAWLSGDNMSVYQTLKLPPLAPPGIVFPIVWTVLYILMGISAYLIYQSISENKKSALIVYVIQLFLNALWSPIFFRMEAYLFAFVWLVVLWVFILIMIIKFYPINKTAALLQIPYLLWVTFAGYLNFAIYLLNR